MGYRELCAAMVEQARDDILGAAIEGPPNRKALRLCRSAWHFLRSEWGGDVLSMFNTLRDGATGADSERVPLEQSVVCRLIYRQAVDLAERKSWRQ